MTTLVVAGWLSALVAAAFAVTLRKRLESTADAEHELRGPLAALSLARESSRRGRLAEAELSAVLDSQLDRALRGLGELTAARSGRRAAPKPGPVRLDALVRGLTAGWDPVARARGRVMRLEWAAGPVTVRADRDRLSQALGNLMSNAVEHGDGRIILRARRRGGAVRLKIASSGGWNGSSGTNPHRRRGRGLAIAARAVEESGGSLAVAARPSEAELTIDLPLDEP